MYSGRVFERAAISETSRSSQGLALAWPPHSVAPMYNGAPTDTREGLLGLARSGFPFCDVALLEDSSGESSDAKPADPAAQHPLNAPAVIPGKRRDVDRLLILSDHFRIDWLSR